EPGGVFDAIPALKRELSINVELAAPSDFIPPLADWRERSQWIGQFGKLQVYHYDFLSQALSKLERGHAKDLLDVTEMLRRRLVTAEALLTHAEAIRSQLKRYPAVDEESFMRRVKEFLGQSSNASTFARRGNPRQWPPRSGSGSAKHLISPSNDCF